MSTDRQITGKSRHVLQLRKQVSRLAGNRNDVMVIGEPGVGKTSVAALIAGTDAIISLDLAQESESGVKSALAGIVKGTVIFERLEEAGYRVQDEVASYLSSRRGEVRVILTLCSSPVELLNQRKLKEMLCTAIGGFDTVEILPLRDRPEDIPLLVKQFAGGLAIDINALETLVKLPWKENIHQLKTLIERCISSAVDGRFVLPAELLDERTEVAKIVGDLMGTEKPALDSSLDLMESSIIRRTLERFGFNESKSAEFLGMTEHAFGQKLKRLALVKSR